MALHYIPILMVESFGCENNKKGTTFSFIFFLSIHKDFQIFLCNATVYFFGSGINHLTLNPFLGDFIVGWMGSFELQFGSWFHDFST